MKAPSAEDFARWRDDRVTRFVFAALAHNADECRETWLATSWEHENANALYLKELRTRADANRALIDTNYEGFCETLGLEPVYD